MALPLCCVQYLDIYEAAHRVRFFWFVSLSKILTQIAKKITLQENCYSRFRSLKRK